MSHTQETQKTPRDIFMEANGLHESIFGLEKRYKTVECVPFVKKDGLHVLQQAKNTHLCLADALVFHNTGATTVSEFNEFIKNGVFTLIIKKSCESYTDKSAFKLSIPFRLMSEIYPAKQAATTDFTQSLGLSFFMNSICVDILEHADIVYLIENVPNACDIELYVKNTLLSDGELKHRRAQSNKTNIPPENFQELTNASTATAVATEKVVVDLENVFGLVKGYFILGNTESLQSLHVFAKGDVPLLQYTHPSMIRLYTHRISDRLLYVPYDIDDMDWGDKEKETYTHALNHSRVGSTAIHLTFAEAQTGSYEVYGLSLNHMRYAFGQAAPQFSRD